MTTTIFIEKNQRIANKNLINEIADSVYGSIEQAAYSEEFIPERGRVQIPKNKIFANFLLSSPKLLWAIQYDNTTVGFILIGDMPHHNAMGISINSEYSRKGIATEAFNQIKTHPEISYPVFGYTSVRNVNAQGFLERIGFIKEPGKINFLGEISLKYKIEL
jgi:RimJ/RimL family protein N-acetyltransferase